MAASTDTDTEKGYQYKHNYQRVQQQDYDESIPDTARDNIEMEVHGPSSRQAQQAPAIATPPMRRPLKSRIISFIEFIYTIFPRKPNTSIFIGFLMFGFIILLSCFKSVIENNPPILLKTIIEFFHGGRHRVPNDNGERRRWSTNNAATAASKGRRVVELEKSPVEDVDSEVRMVNSYDTGGAAASLAVVAANIVTVGALEAAVFDGAQPPRRSGQHV
ncbi:hypothetical protein V500_05560 [Pseudogymnoascus sp. VKM F-4518 (FW-2643)]|nr:hypothetical protein V500_05560 [Pseudogymnoascus sp. VKM F-4518 (FW-2643)]